MESRYSLRNPQLRKIKHEASDPTGPHSIFVRAHRHLSGRMNIANPNQAARMKATVIIVA
jgi:hypothetical protein